MQVPINFKWEKSIVCYVWTFYCNFFSENQRHYGHNQLSVQPDFLSLFHAQFSSCCVKDISAMCSDVQQPTRPRKQSGKHFTQRDKQKLTVLTQISLVGVAILIGICPKTVSVLDFVFDLDFCLQFSLLLHWFVFDR